MSSPATITRRQFGLGAAGLTSLPASGCLSDITDDGGHEHEHEDPPWEWGGLYELESGTYTYAYHEGPDPDMRLAVVPADEGGEHGLFHAGETATELFEKAEADTVLTDGDTTRPSADRLYRVDFESDGETTIELRVESDGYYSIVTEHVPAEFEAELRSETGGEMTTDVTEPHSSHSHGEDDHGDDHDH
ncbi:hypothetical protein [Natronorubrum halophilum]|uniref:hypothetical protein n=1 Tax=Natronorubrum halophilum TaxID=1702106 RepID=UPI000EF69A38|nr:hypothetical protein [Natronorubrum halophilum]